MSATNSNTARHDSQNSLSDRNGKRDKSDAYKNKKRCPSPAEIFTAASALSAFLAANLDQREINTVINLLSLVTANLSAVVTQQEICEGEVVQPTI